MLSSLVALYQAYFSVPEEDNRVNGHLLRVLDNMRAPLNEIGKPGLLQGGEEGKSPTETYQRPDGISV